MSNHATHTTNHSQNHVPNHDEKVTYFAETDSRNKRIPFGIKNKDRTRHIYVIGKTGMGKSTLLENLAIQDIQNGEGMCFIDPHGKTADLLLEYVPQERIKDVVYFAPFDTEYPVSFNVMEDVGPGKRHLVANGLMSAFKKIWVDAWSARMEYILNNILLALLEYPDSTLLGVNRMLADKDFRNKVVANIKDPSVKSFWVDEFAKYGERYMQEAGAAIQNKIGQFVSNPLVRNIIGQPKSSFDVREAMDSRKILIINLSKGRVGEANANLLGSMIITKLYLGALSRADVTESKLKMLPSFYLYVDEFQSFANESFADILSEARKYKLSLTVAHQYIEQMSEEVRDAVFGNVGTMIAFRVGAFDAEVFEKEFAPIFVSEDIVNLGFTQIYLKLMIDGVSSQPFSANSLPPIKKPDINFRDDIVEHSRKVFAHPKSEVEELIHKWHEPIVIEKKPRADGPASSPTSSSSVGPKPAPTRSELKDELKNAFAQRDEKRDERKSAPPRSDRSPAPAASSTTPITTPVSAPRNAALESPQIKPKLPEPHHEQAAHAPSSGSSAPAHLPLNALKKNPQSKGPSAQNLNQLKDALKDIVEKAKKENSAKPQAAQPAVASKKPESVESAPKAESQAQIQTQEAQPVSRPQAQQKAAPKAQPAQQTSSQHQQQQTRTSSEQSSKVNEVPEDVLRRVLDIGKKK